MPDPTPFLISKFSFIDMRPYFILLCWHFLYLFSFQVDAKPHTVIYVGSLDGNVYALNAQTGKKYWIFKQHWSFQTDKAITSTPLVAQKGIVIGSYPTDSGAGQ